MKKTLAMTIKFASFCWTPKFAWTLTLGSWVSFWWMICMLTSCCDCCANRLTELSQERRPSSHVNRRFASSESPQRPNQAPPIPQQLDFPCFRPHLEHTGMVVSPSAVTVVVGDSSSMELSHERTPSLHVYKTPASSGSPQRPNQAPPGPQQLGLSPDFVPHLGHAGIVAGALEVCAAVNIWTWARRGKHDMQIAYDLCQSLLWQLTSPSRQVWSKSSPSSPQLLNQVPPREQQLSLTVNLLTPHVGHTKAFVVAIGDTVTDGSVTSVDTLQSKNIVRHTLQSTYELCSYLCRHGCLACR